MYRLVPKILHAAREQVSRTSCLVLRQLASPRLQHTKPAPFDLLQKEATLAKYFGHWARFIVCLWRISRDAGLRDEFVMKASSIIEILDAMTARITEEELQQLVCDLSWLLISTTYQQEFGNPMFTFLALMAFNFTK